MRRWFAIHGKQLNHGVVGGWLNGSLIAVLLCALSDSRNVCLPFGLRASAINKTYCVQFPKRLHNFGHQNHHNHEEDLIGP